MEIPGYQIVRQIGKGGMATVYLAVQESLDREVAIKLMSPFLAEDKTFGERFLREAKIVARLSHPNIIAVYDVGTVDDQYYIAMQYSPGGDLKSRIAQGLTEPQVVLITQQIASALQYAHDNGFIHRDVKPANVLFDQHGNACLTDFGVAKATHSATTTLTVAGSVIGTPVYMSPEQARGDNIDHRSDLYSLGIVFYEMLSGQPPFHGDSGVSIAIKHISDPVPRLDPQLSPYQEFVDKLLCKNREGRFQSGNEIIQELNNIHQFSSGVHTRLMTGPMAPVQITGSQQVVIPGSVSQPIPAVDSQRMSRPGMQPAAPSGVRVPTSATSRKTPWIVGTALVVVAAVLGGVFFFQAQMQTVPPKSTQAEKPTIAVAPVDITPVTTQAEPTPQSLTPVQIQQQQRQEKVASLLQTAEAAFAGKRFIYPEDDNALDRYRQVLAIDSDNSEAQQGIQRISDWYISQSREAMDKQQWFLAEQHLSQAQKAQPDHPQLAALQSDLAHGREQTAQKSEPKTGTTKKPAPRTTSQPSIATAPKSVAASKPLPKAESKPSAPVTAASVTSSNQSPTKKKPEPRPAEKPSQPVSPASSPQQVATLDASLEQQALATEQERQRMEALEEQIRELSDQAAKLLEKKDMSLADIEEIHEYYKKIDELSPNHVKAKTGYALLITECVTLATIKINQKDYNDARAVVEKGLTLDSKNRRLTYLQRRLQKAPHSNLSDTKKSKERR